MDDQPCGCLICTGMPPGTDADILSTVARHGWSAVWVPAGVDFAYTVGLWHTFRLPELAMFGLNGDNMQDWLNGCVAHIRAAGLPAAEVPFTGVIDGFPTQLRPVDESWRDAFFGTAHRFYRGQPVPFQQLVWPDAAGRWPWDEQATASSRTRQAFTWLPVDRHPAGGWRLLGEFGDDFPLPTEADSWALTARSVLDGTRDPALVLFDEGAFDVLDDRGHDADDLCVTHLGALVQRHPSLRRLGDLREGSAATRTPGGGWDRAELTARQRDASVSGWDRGQEIRVIG
ncbi:DUF4262 domain-containing protein [Dactylosporangium sp. NPDC049525]|uniref:DUF4262 domain-containing protein n=1 Tax=Dactylosporangium sp. NPDC049525 TaxID=3154730 RepID=UPI003434F131